MILRALLVLVSLATPLSSAAMQRQHEPAEVAVCVVAPRVEPVEDADGAGVVPVPYPSLVVIEPLEELRIERAGLPVWRGQAREGAALPMPFLWPTAPIRPGETVLVRLRPQQAPHDAFAHVLLVGASAARMAATAELLNSLGRSSQGWMLAIEAALQSGDVPLAWALLFASQAPLSSDLLALRQEVVRRGCGD